MNFRIPIGTAGWHCNHFANGNILSGRELLVQNVNDNGIEILFNHFDLNKSYINKSLFKFMIYLHVSFISAWYYTLQKDNNLLINNQCLRHMNIYMRNLSCENTPCDFAFHLVVRNW